MSKKHIDYERGLTFEKVWAGIQELGKKYDAIFEREAKERQEREEREAKERQERQEREAKERQERQEREAKERQERQEREAKERQERQEREAKEWQERQEREAKERQEREEREAKEYEKRQKEAKEREEREAKEDEKRRKEAEERRKEAEERRKEAAERIRILEENVNKTTLAVNRLNENMGGISNRFGEMVEHLVAPNIAERFNELGYQFDGVARGGFEIRENGQVATDVDILLENGKTIAIVEVKAKPTTHDIKRHIKRMQIVRRYYERHGNTDKELIGAVAGAVFPEKVKMLTLETGFFVITQTGDTVKIDVPKNFKPRIF